MMQWKSCFLPRICLLSLLPALGCGSSPTTPTRSNLPYHGTKITIACPTDLTRQALSIYSQHWATVQEVTVESVTEKELTPGKIDSLNADLILIPAAALGDWVTADSIELIPDDLRATESDYQWIELIPLYSSRLLVWNEKTYALPILGEAPVCFYRRDLLSLPEAKKAFQQKYGYDLSPPTTWKMYRDIAEHFSGARKMGLPPLPSEEADLDRHFYSIAASFARRALSQTDLPPGGERGEDDLFSFQFDLHTGEPRITSPGFVHTVDLLKELQPFRAEGNGSPWWNTFKEGKAILCLGQARHLYQFHLADSKVREKVGVVGMPGSSYYFDYATGEKVEGDTNHVPYLGSASWLGVVPKSSKHKAAAFSLLADLSGPKLSQQIVNEPQWGGGALRREHWSEPWYAFGLSGMERLQLKRTIQKVHDNQLKNQALRLRIPGQRAYLTALTKTLRSALTGNSKEESKAVLERVKSAWGRLIEQEGEKAHIRNYRLSLGLNPGSR